MKSEYKDAQRDSLSVLVIAIAILNNTLDEKLSELIQSEKVIEDVLSDIRASIDEKNAEK